MPRGCGYPCPADANALGVGSPISYQGFTIGQVEEAKFLPEKSEMQYQLFINAL
jgi:paraquat-inducible protein B